MPYKGLSNGVTTAEEKKLELVRDSREHDFAAAAVTINAADLISSDLPAGRQGESLVTFSSDERSPTRGPL